MNDKLRLFVKRWECQQIINILGDIPIIDIYNFQETRLKLLYLENIKYKLNRTLENIYD